MLEPKLMNNLTQPTEQSSFLTITSLPNRKWFNPVNPRTGKVITAGGCTTTEEFSLSDIQKLFRGNLDGIPTHLRRIAFQVHTIRRAFGDYGKTIALPKLFLESVPAWEGREKGETKKTLPAFVPSIHFRKQALARKLESLEKPITPKRLAGIDPDIWDHTGIFGIDIDLGKDGNPGEAENLWQMAKGIRENAIPGYLFMYQSPSGGLKILFKSNYTPSGPLDKRLSEHAALFYYFSSEVRKQGFAVDTSCKDAARLQFLWLGGKSHFPETFSPASFDKKFLETLNRELLERRMENLKGGGGILRPLQAVLDADDPGNCTLPPLISKDFVNWLRETGHEKEAETILHGMRPAGDKWTGFCPCCEEHCTTPRQDTDLMCKVDADNPYNVIWYCLHDSCHSLKKVKNPMWKLWDSFTDSRIDSLTGIALDESDLEEGGKEGDDVSELPDTVKADVLEAWGRFKTNLANLINSEPNYGRSITEQYDPNSFVCGWPETKEVGPKNDKVTVPLPQSDANVIWYITECLRLIPVRNMLTGETELVRRDRTDEPGYIVNDGTYAQLHSLLNRHIPGNHIKCIYQCVQNLETRFIYHPIVLLASAEKWDGKDRLTELTDTLVPDPGWELSSSEEWENLPEEEKERQKKDFIHQVIVTWLECAYMRFERVITGKCPKRTNAMPVLVGKQGLFKNRWISQLAPVRGAVSEVSEMNPSNKDNLGLLIDGGIVHLDELDSTSFNENYVSKLKAYLTTSQIKYRPPYGRVAGWYETRASFIGSTNREQFLVDETGSRRFFALYLSRIDLDTLEKMNKFQLWAQVKERVESNMNEAGIFRKLEAISTENNETNAVTKNEDDFLASYLRYVPADEEVEPGVLRRDTIPVEHSSVKMILWNLRQRLGNPQMPTAKECRMFARSIAGIAPAKSTRGTNQRYETFRRRVNGKQVRVIPVEIADPGTPSVKAEK